MFLFFKSRSSQPNEGCEMFELHVMGNCDCNWHAVKKLLVEQQLQHSWPCLVWQLNALSDRLCVCLAKVFERTSLEDASFSSDIELLSVQLEELVLLALSIAHILSADYLPSFYHKAPERMYVSHSLCVTLCLEWDLVSSRCSHLSSLLLAHIETRVE